MAIFNVHMKRTQVYDFVIEAKDDDEALDVANEAIGDVDDYDLEDGGWSAESREIEDVVSADEERCKAIKYGNYVKTSDVFSDCEED